MILFIQKITKVCTSHVLCKMRGSDENAIEKQSNEKETTRISKQNNRLKMAKTTQSTLKQFTIHCHSDSEWSLFENIKNMVARKKKFKHKTF